MPVKFPRWLLTLIASVAAIGGLIYLYREAIFSQKNVQTDRSSSSTRPSYPTPRPEHFPVDRFPVEPESSNPPTTLSAAPPRNNPTAPPSAPAPTRFAPPDAASVVQVQAVSRSIRDYGSRFGGNPQGTNAEITGALNGHNAGSVLFLRTEQRRTNAEGELLDPWGTPYFFHQLSAHQTEIRSAGPDHQMWTGDDLVER